MSLDVGAEQILYRDDHANEIEIIIDVFHRNHNAVIKYYCVHWHAVVRHHVRRHPHILTLGNMMLYECFILCDLITL